MPWPNILSSEMAKPKFKSKQFDSRAQFLTNLLYCFSFKYKHSCYHAIYVFQTLREDMLSVKSHGKNNIGSGEKQGWSQSLKKYYTQNIKTNVNPNKNTNISKICCHWHQVSQLALCNMNSGTYTFSFETYFLEGICFNRDMVIKIKNLIQTSLFC